MIAKRYTIFNKHIGGSNRLPQGFHGLNRLHSTKANMSPEAQALFAKWEKSETEVVLIGGNDEQLEALAAALANITELPSAKFNEADLRDSCTVVTFVATDRIVACGNEVRGMNVKPYEIEDYLAKNTVRMPEGRVQLTPDEIFVVANIAYLRLAD